MVGIFLNQMLKEQFKDFARETESIGQERVASANEICDQLIALDHSDSATIAEWKDNVNEAWADLLELIDTRTQLLQASWELHKFFYECKDTLERIYVSASSQFFCFVFFKSTLLQNQLLYHFHPPSLILPLLLLLTFFLFPYIHILLILCVGGTQPFFNF